MANYVFVPLINGVKYTFDNNTKTFSIIKEGNGEIKITREEGGIEISRIEEKSKNNKKYVEIHNILVLTGYAINENSLELVPTLDPCDYVKGILVAGKIQENENTKGNVNTISITFPKDEVMNKLYFIRKSNVKFQNIDNVTIDLIVAENKNVGKTRYNSFDPNNKIDGIKDLYNISDTNAVEDLKRKLSEIISYYSIQS